MDYSNYEVITIQPNPGPVLDIKFRFRSVWGGLGLGSAPGVPYPVQCWERHEKTGLIAHTLRGAYWIRPGKKPCRINSTHPLLN